MDLCRSLLLCLSAQSKWNLRELGFSDLNKQQLDELVKRVVACLKPDNTALPLGTQTSWRTSYLSTTSFFHNKHGEKKTNLFVGETNVCDWILC